MNADIREFFERLTGHYALSPLIPVAGAIPMVLGFTILELRQAEGVAGGGVVLVIALIGQVVSALMFEVARRARGPWGKTLTSRVVSLLAVYVAVSQVRMLVMISLMEPFGHANTAPTWLRLVSSALIVVFGASLAAAAFGSFAQYATRRDALLSSLLHSERVLRSQELAAKGFRREVGQSVSARLGETGHAVSRSLDQLEKAIRDGNRTVVDVSDFVTETDGKWRELSHDMWEQASHKPQNPGFFEVLTVAARGPLVHPPLVAIAGFLMFILGFIRIFPPDVAALWSVGWGVALWICVTVLKKVVDTSTKPGNALFVGSGALMFVGTGFFTHPTITVLDGLILASLQFSVVGFYFLVTALFAVSQNNRAILDALRDRLDQTTLARLSVESEFTALARQMAGELHAGVRGTFIAAMMRVQRLVDGNQPIEALEEIAQLRRFLADPHALDTTEGTSDELRQFLRNWRGLVTIRGNILDVPLPAGLEESITHVVKNAVTDAVRHGKATEVEIDLFSDGDAVVLNVINDGRPLVDEVSAGLGSYTLDQLATAGWSREACDDGRTMLRAGFLSSVTGPVSPVE